MIERPRVRARLCVSPHRQDSEPPPMPQWRRDQDSRSIVSGGFGPMSAFARHCGSTASPFAVPPGSPTAFAEVLRPRVGTGRQLRHRRPRSGRHGAVLTGPSTGASSPSRGAAKAAFPAFSGPQRGLEDAQRSGSASRVLDTLVLPRRGLHECRRRLDRRNEAPRWVYFLKRPWMGARVGQAGDWLCSYVFTLRRSG